MTRLLEEAIKHLRALPQEEQDGAAEVVFAFVSSDERQYRSLPRNVAQPHAGRSRPAAKKQLSRKHTSQRRSALYA